MMYDELVKRLRKATGWKNASEHYSLMKEAANAIEELQEDNAALNGTVTNLLNLFEQIKDFGKPPEVGRA